MPPLPSPVRPISVGKIARAYRVWAWVVMAILPPYAVPLVRLLAFDMFRCS
jgi:hypothetical protein